MSYRLRIDRFRAAANAAGDLSGIAIARRTGLSEAQVSRLLRGVQRPRYETILKIGRTYGLAHDDLVEETAA